ncbi:cystinosin homolog [Palaemon carinicauda]|uniref:cystinosin homolog n=1 Tax=Palaemon carinicauda TaxID=392227 RepID=UPI0035B5A680
MTAADVSLLSSTAMNAHLLLLVLSAGVISVSTPVSALQIPSLLQVQVQAKGNESVVCEFKEHDLRVELGLLQNLTLHIEGTIEENVTLIFSTDASSADILEGFPNITLVSDEMINQTLLTVKPIAVGKTVLITKAIPPNMTDVSKAFVRLVVPHSNILDYVSDTVGWIYFMAWSVSFYPQTFSNWRRKSVIGLHFDFLSLNTIGFLVYSIFNICLFGISYIEAEYFKRHPFGVNPVQLNDVIFSVHAFIACCIQVFQCFIYDRGDQQISNTAKSIFSTIGLVTIVMVILGAASVIAWLDFLYYLSYVKLFITLIKYIPQAYYNYRRKSTSGWSIGNIFLDITGGALSIVQMIIISYNYNDWGSIFGDPTKFGLGLFSVIFDVFFMVQHYILYRGNTGYQHVCESPTPSHVSPLTESAASSVDYGSTGSVY